MGQKYIVLWVINNPKEAKKIKLFQRRCEIFSVNLDLL